MMSEYKIERIFNEGKFLTSIVGTEYFEMSLDIYNKLFDKTIPLRIGRIPSQNLNTQIYLRIEEVVNISFAFGQEIKKEVEDDLWIGYNFFCENSQNPFGNNSFKSNKELNMNHYKIDYREELLNKTNLVSMHTIVENSEKEDTEVYTSMNFAAEWIGDGYYEICFSGMKISKTFHHQ